MGAKQSKANDLLISQLNAQLAAQQHVHEALLQKHNELILQHKAAETKYNRLLQAVAPGQSPSNISPDIPNKISDEAIDTFVASLLADPEINICALPDAIERTIYKKVLKVILGAIGHVADNADIELIGHRITVRIEPVVVVQETAVRTEQEMYVDVDFLRTHPLWGGRAKNDSQIA